MNKAQLVERIAEVVIDRKLPPLLDVKDVSTDDVRIELELKGDADERMVMAYLFKHTPLQTTFPVNLTCLVPTEQPGVGRPDRLDLRKYCGTSSGSASTWSRDAWSTSARPSAGGFTSWRGSSGCSTRSTPSSC